MLALYTQNPKHFLKWWNGKQAELKSSFEFQFSPLTGNLFYLPNTVNMQPPSLQKDFMAVCLWGHPLSEKLYKEKKPNQDLGEKKIKERTKQFTYTQNNCKIMTSAIPCTSLVCAWAEAPACRNPRAGYRIRGWEFW